jgi:hypothetical protein
MKRIIAGLGVALALAGSGPASAWGWQGHEYVGNLAYDLLNPTARKRVNVLLGTYGPAKPISLGEAAVWPDCIRDISGPDVGPHTFKQTKSTSKVCIPFGKSASQRARMEDYADRNWTNCLYSGKKRECHKSFHFDDVNVETHADYGPDYAGAEESDVVRAIKAAITVLQCPTGSTCAYEGPFAIKDKREALFLLAHFIGDLHQPLHVGAIYLTANAPGPDNGSPTFGGNLLLLSPGHKSNNLHHHWDDIEGSLGIHAAQTVVQSGCATPTAVQRLLDRPAAWASESVVAAATAYDTLSYAKDTALPAYWDITFADRPAYDAALKATQRKQLMLGGARLAEVLNSVWPDTAKAKACA